MLLDRIECAAAHDQNAAHGQAFEALKVAAQSPRHVTIFADYPVGVIATTAVKGGTFERQIFGFSFKLPPA